MYNLSMQVRSLISVFYNPFEAFRRTLNGSIPTWFQFASFIAFYLFLNINLPSNIRSESGIYFFESELWPILLNLIGIFFLGVFSSKQKLTNPIALYLNCFLPISLWLWGGFIAYTFITIPIGISVDGHFSSNMASLSFRFLGSVYINTFGYVLVCFMIKNASKLSGKPKSA